MAVDYGDVRTGVAVSDELATLAGEAWVIEEKSQKALVKLLAKQAISRNVSFIVVGNPINMDGTIGPRAEKSEQFANLLRSACETEVVLWDERLTTISAHQILRVASRRGKKRKNTVDAVAASLILQSYLDFIKL